MNAIRARLPVFAAALWWGSLSVIGFMAVPLMFANAPSTALAGQLGAKLFSAESWVSLGCGLALLYAARGERVELGVLAGLLLALLLEYAVAPRIVARQNLALWHSLGTALYAAQWFCAAAVLWKMAASRAAAS